MEKEIFSQIIKSIPAVDYGIEGLEVHRTRTPEGTIYFVEARREVPFPQHAHAEQWTIVVSGESRFEAEGVSRIHKKGDVYTIPAGVKHTVTLFEGYAEIAYVNDPHDGE